MWHFAKTASELPEFEVIITGPLWLPRHVPRAHHFPKRLDRSTYEDFLAAFGKCEYLFAGHEYFDKPEWIEPFERCAETLISYQLHPYRYTRVSFDAKRRFLFCYSDEMCREYREQNPVKALLFHSGVDEVPFFTPIPKDYLLWIGRLDKDKAPHFAVEAAALLGMPLVVLGEPIYQPEYFRRYESIFRAPHVHLLGVKHGHEKVRMISEAACVLYTIDSQYTEAGAGVLGEVLACGVPIAGMSWRGDDAICEAVNDPRLGVVVRPKSGEDSTVPGLLAGAALECLALDRLETFRVGSMKYDPHRLVRAMFASISAQAH